MAFDYFMATVIPVKITKGVAKNQRTYYNVYLSDNQRYTAWNYNAIAHLKLNQPGVVYLKRDGKWLNIVTQAEAQKALSQVQLQSQLPPPPAIQPVPTEEPIQSQPTPKESALARSEQASAEEEIPKDDKLLRQIERQNQINRSAAVKAAAIYLSGRNMTLEDLITTAKRIIEFIEVGD